MVGGRPGKRAPSQQIQFVQSAVCGWAVGEEQGPVGLLAALTSLQGKLEKSLDHLQKQMEDALLFQAQAEETCALWQAGG